MPKQPVCYIVFNRLIETKKRFRYPTKLPRDIATVASPRVCHEHKIALSVTVFLRMVANLYSGRPNSFEKKQDVEKNHIQHTRSLVYVFIRYDQTRRKSEHFH